MIHRAAINNQLRYEAITLEAYLLLDHERPLTGDTFGGGHHRRSRNTTTQQKD